MKEAEYIINNQYNEYNMPHKYKFLFEQKKNYLLAKKVSFKYDFDELIKKHTDEINSIRLSFAEENHDLYEMVSSLTKQLREMNILKEDAEAILEMEQKEVVD